MWLDPFFQISTITVGGVVYPKPSSIEFVGGNGVLVTAAQDATGVVTVTSEIDPSSFEFSPWQQFASNAFNHTAPTVATLLTIGGTPQDVLQTGTAVRVLHNNGIVVSDAESVFDTAHGLTGVTSDNVNSRGRMYLRLVDDGAAGQHVEIYKRFGYAAAALIGHTGTFDTNGAKNVLADNDSGLGGVVHIQDAQPISGVVFEFFTWHRINDYSASTRTLTLDGPSLETTTDDVAELWYSPFPSQVVQLEYFISGSYDASASTNGLLQDISHNKRYWQLPAARVVYMSAQAGANAHSHYINGFEAIAGVIYGTGPTDGLLITDTNRVDEGVAIQPLAAILEPGNEYDFATTQGGSGDTNLSICMVVVLE